MGCKIDKMFRTEHFVYTEMYVQSDGKSRWMKELENVDAGVRFLPKWEYAGWSRIGNASLRERVPRSRKGSETRGTRRRIARAGQCNRIFRY